MLRPSKRSSSDDWGGFCIKSILFIVEFYKYKKPLKTGKYKKIHINIIVLDLLE